MKTRFNTYDIVCSITELQKLIGMRVNNIYDIDNKTYLIRLQRTEEKAVLLLESGNRFHSTAFEWPKNVAPSGFSMKMRKHLKNKRLERLQQLGTDRIVDMQFGTNEAAYHVILELYDRGNIILTDFELTILYVLRPHTEGEEVRFAVREKYPIDRARVKLMPQRDEVQALLSTAKPGDHLRKLFIPHLDYGPALIEHALLEHGFNSNAKIGKGFDPIADLDQLMAALNLAEELMQNARTHLSKGFIIQKQEQRPSAEAGAELYYSKQEFHPFLFKQTADQPHQEFVTFNQAVDEFFSSLESQKLDMKAIHQEREAVKKLNNVKKDHTQRLHELEQTQQVDKHRAELISRNQTLVDQAILAVQSALASQMSWPDIQVYVSEAQVNGDPIAGSIKKLKLDSNHMTMHLSDPYDSDSSDETETTKLKPMLIDIDLALSAFANARRYYDQKRTAAKKQQRTIDAQGKALKSAEKRTKQTLKDVQTITSINKARKVYWFEKFFWFISSENYLVIGGRDQQQNEMLVKRYMKANDIYVHADIHGAASVLVKNLSDQPVPPKTLNEAGTMAICYSVAWEAKVVTSAWWVTAAQVTKTAPTGEYLTTGSFMVRGKKNYLPPCHLIMGLSFLFKLEDGSVERHKDERRVRAADDELLIASKEDELEELPVIDESEDEIDELSPNKDIIQEEPKEENNENRTSSISSTSDDEDTKYPDTHIKIQHFQGTQMNVVAESVGPFAVDPDDSDSEKVVFLGDDKPVLLKAPGGRSRVQSETKTKNLPPKDAQREIPTKNRDDDKQPQTQVKRGQKGKLKKIKEKYKDQDDEERKLRMDILQTSSKPKDSKKSKKQLIAQQPKKVKPVAKPRPTVAATDEPDPEEGEAEQQVQAEVDMINTLTGVPAAEDELLFAVTVVAPYNTLTSYKYKVKLTPGTGKRGKAARTALAMFLRDRTATQREKDLLRSVKDENLARNLPGKVKVSAPKMQNAYKK